jgi:tetratricopeptide (TPR) repeat protein
VKAAPVLSQDAVPGVRMFDAEDRDLLATGRSWCLQKNYREALRAFQDAFELLTSHDESVIGPQFLSHYGAAVAAGGRREEGRKLCERSIQLEPYEPEHYLNLGRVHRMAGDLSAAFRAFDRGLAILPDHPSLRAEKAELERRRFHPIPSLSRNHPLNRCLGKILSLAGGR